MDKIKEQVQALDAEDWRELLDWVVGVEKPRRDASPAVSEGQGEIIRDLREQGTITDPAPEGEVAPWRDPGTDHSRMYLLGDRVSHGGRVWTSRVNGLNSWEPGAPGVYSNVWEADPEDPAPETPSEGENTGTDTPGDSVPVTEFKPGEQVKVGDVRTYNGKTYRVLKPHTTALHWAPDVAHSLWTEVTE